ncbi:6-carboxytetrahydropterin synthase [Streptomyces sp900105245]|uniref:6-carboxy-5,6,7,8-tetrahydropterin synthase n=1 Tax=Streptomyces sp. 900105245 TaxID=3154379 RepID=A0ABV1UM86_9ACTN
MKHEIGIRHNFETAHRIPVLGGKCVNLHGHSWQCEVVFSAPALQDGVVIDFSGLKSEVRGWIDRYLDHGAMLSADDPLVPVLQAEGSRLFRFGAADPEPYERFAKDLSWPTVESVAMVIGRMTNQALQAVPHAPGTVIDHVEVRETSVNHARWNSSLDGHNERLGI